MFKRIIAVIICCIMLTSCTSSQNSVERQMNRSLLLDSGFKLGGSIPGLPFSLPELDLGFRINFRRPTIQEEVDLNLSKVGKWRGQENPAPPLASPKPFSATPKE